jgi:hypothetical protein
VGNNEYCRNCKRSIPIIICVSRLGEWSSVRLKRATVYKLISVTYNISQHVIAVAREGESLPLVLVRRQFSKYGVHYLSKLPQTLMNLKVNHPASQVQNESADYQHSDGRHSCEVHSECNNAHGSPLPLTLPLIPGDALYPNVLYRNLFVFKP